ncbi:hypothetical protein Mapa_009296 [Marchantia paleacea]|nr:hypothetical protein Mapa_009296 [Marchantia paleacea]
MYSTAGIFSGPSSRCHLMTSPATLDLLTPGSYIKSLSLGSGSATCDRLCCSSRRNWAFLNMYPVIITLYMSCARFSATVETEISKNCGGRVPSMLVTVCRIASTTCSGARFTNFSMNSGCTFFTYSSSMSRRLVSLFLLAELKVAPSPPIGPLPLSLPLPLLSAKLQHTQLLATRLRF